jgi:hypothetical protein
MRCPVTSIASCSCIVEVRERSYVLHLFPHYLSPCPSDGPMSTYHRLGCGHKEAYTELEAQINSLLFTTGFSLTMPSHSRVSDGR